jgi:hypothetical protein
METLNFVILNKVQRNIEEALIKELDNRTVWTGHGIIIKDIEDVKMSMHTFVLNEMDIANRRTYLLTR